MIDSLQVDLKEHDKKVHEALALLENQTYLQRNGDLYEYLTDDEKDIEEEIKSTDIDDGQVTDLFKQIVFDSIIGENKIRYLENKQEYDFTSKIDGVILGKEKELTVEMVLPDDEHMLLDIRMYLKTEKYIRQNQSTTNKDNVKRILFEKAQQNTIRRTTLVTLLRRLLGESAV